MTKPETQKAVFATLGFVIRHSDFFRHSGFDIRH